MNRTNFFSDPSKTIWEDLVSDFLEMACFLNPEEQTRLLDELQKQKIQAENIDVHPCFSINGRLIIVCEESLPKECWIYLVKRGQIQKWKSQGDLATA